MRRLDVRPMMARGEEPFDTIMGAVSQLQPGESLELTAPLEPVPLYRVLGERGFGHRTESLGGGDYRVVFHPEPDGVAGSQVEPLVGNGVDLAQFVPEGFGRRILFDNERVRVVLAAFEPGQEIPVHAPQVDLVMSVLDGLGEIRAGDTVESVRAGDVAIVPAGQARGVRASTPMVVLHVVSPPPSQADHRAVSAGQGWTSEAAAPDLASLILAEHAGLYPEVEHLGRLAVEEGSLESTDLQSRLRKVLSFLNDGLMPHADEEERSIYPAVDRILRATGGATRAMSADHVRIRELARELGQLAEGEQTEEVRRREVALLYGLQAILELHLTKENEEYVPLLNLLAREEKERLHETLTGGHGDHPGAEIDPGER